MDNLVELFCIVDDFIKEIMPELQQNMLPKANKRGPTCRLSQSEIMSIIISFHQSHYRNFKAYYTQYVKKYLHKDFALLVSYSRFVELMPSVLLLLCLFVHFQSKTATGIYFIDSTILAVCHHKRARSNRVFKGMA